jgi:site-specific recombinase XerD
MDTEQVLGAFAEHWRMLGYAEMTLDNYLRRVRRLDMPLDHVTALDLTGQLAIRRRKVGPAALAYEVRAFRAFFGWLADTFEIDNPARCLRTPKVDEPPIRSVSLTDHRAILATCGTRPDDRRDAAMLCILWSTGMRRSEVARIELSHLDVAERTLTIPKSKTGRARTVGLDDDAVKALQRYLRGRHTHRHARSPFLWLSDKGVLTSDGIRQMIERRSGQARVEVSAHMYRRALAERWLAAGGAESLLRAYAGWRSPQLVARYVRANAERLAIAEHRRLL